MLCRRRILSKSNIMFMALSLPLIAGCSVLPIKETSSTLENSIYRRIPYTVEGDYRVINIFYATDRKIKDPSSGLVFGREMSDSLTTGSLSARIQPNVKIGKMLPERIKRQGAIGIQDISSSGEDIFINDLKTAVENSPHKSLLLIVYGFKDDFEMTATKAAYFAYLLDVNTPVLLFDWPGDQSVTPMGYRKALNFASLSGPELGKLLAKIIREVKPDKLWIQSTSMGCQVVCKAFDYMYNEKDLADADAEISHVVMAAPDVSDDEFDSTFKDEIASMADKLTAYVSSDDTALLFAQIIDAEKKLGRQNAKAKRNSQYEEAKDLLYIKSLSPDRISIVDVTDINKASYGHGYDLESPEYYDDFYMRIFDVPPHKNRRLYLVDTEGDSDYWIMR